MIIKIGIFSQLVFIHNNLDHNLYEIEFHVKRRRSIASDSSLNLNKHMKIICKVLSKVPNKIL